MGGLGRTFMNRLVVVIALCALAVSSLAIACGGGNDKPPLTPDSEHSDGPDSGADGAK
jgi:hypothetical protein